MNEVERLEVLQDYQVLDTLEDRYLNELTQIASAICETKISFISLVGKDRQ
ncbi:hypothetical protein G3567_06100 [Psychroflexus sp. YR1-1]|uniref:Uncharacterized protein n=1 Tax=Psychroflexus aurantiacus TaxID=2709310 RepID=A0A6B3R7E4_9FLAO|nr:hypothetical protein [Psychroflexus aurantiacus]NEV93721.1 hypothetical protein [Psychroflexus aurantiacus]